MTNNANPGVTIKRRASTMQVKPEPAPEPEEQESEDVQEALPATAHPDPADSAHEDTTPDDENTTTALKADLEGGMLARDASQKYGWSVPTIRKKAKEWGIKLKRGRPTRATQAASGKAAARKPRKQQRRAPGSGFSVDERIGALEWLMKIAEAESTSLAKTAAVARAAIEAYDKLTT